MVRYVPYLLAGILLMVMLMFGLRQKEEELLQKSYRPTVEQTLPDFAFRTLDGRELKLSS